MTDFGDMLLFWMW